MDDKSILALLLQRSERAIQALADRFGAGLTRLARNILTSPEDAEEAVSDTYLALWNAIPPAEPSPLQPFVYRVGRNTALKRLRHETAQKRSAYEISMEELDGCIGTDALEDILDARTLGKTIDKFLEYQSRTSRVIFLRRYWFGDSVKDIAALLGMKENAVSVRLNRLRAQLKYYLTEEGYIHES